MYTTIAGCLGPRAAQEQDRVRASVAAEGLAGGAAPRAETLGPFTLAAGGGGTVERRDGALLALDGRLDERPPDVAAAYRRGGAGALASLRGDFALALWDGERGSGALVRDPIGARALYWARTGGALWFASELRVLLRLLPTAPAPRAAAVARWLSNVIQPPGETLFEGVQRLGPGERLDVDAAGGVRSTRWWAPRYAGTLAIERPDAIAETGRRLDDAVERRTRGDGGVGVLLSGGLDSASVAAVAAGVAPGRTRGYSAVFPELPTLDEARWIDSIADWLDIPSERNATGPVGGMVADAIRWTEATGLPALGWGDFWEGPLWERARGDGVQVMLSGDGGDEVFGMRPPLVADRLRRGRLTGALGVVREFPGAGDAPPLRPVLGALVRHGARPLVPPAADRLRRRVRSELPRYIRPELSRAVGRAPDPTEWRGASGPLWWRWASDVLTRQIEAVGVFDDMRLRAKGHGLVHAQPLMDPALIEWLLQVPPEHFLDRRLTRPLLRGSMRGRLPEAVRERAGKSRFDPMIVGCLGGPDLPAVRALLGAPDAEIRAYVDQARIREELLDRPPAQHPDGAFSWGLRVWRLVSAEVWLRSLQGRDFSNMNGPLFNLAGDPAPVSVARQTTREL